ncbi:hypothetical protein ABZ815_25830 [Nonomuraea sp. NPDC047529]|uniref:hypothetical protein n=1 Tax=Nonomuraea sp. NPDC047529 TaxID=3155623 RepID=UPI0033E51F42
MAEAVLAVLAGLPAKVAAGAINVRTETLTEAIEAYQAAGYRALEARTTDHGWYSIRAQFADWNTAEQAAATDLGPRLDHLQDRKLIGEWWFIRKPPCWRLRLRPLGNLVPEAKAFRAKAPIQGHNTVDVGLHNQGEPISSAAFRTGGAMDVVAVANQVMPYVMSAIAAYGTAVLTKTQDLAADESVNLGKRLLERFTKRDESRAQIEAAVQDVAEVPDDEDFPAALRVQLKKALAVDPVLAEDVVQLLGSAPAPSVSQSVAGSRIGGDNIQIGQARDVHIGRRSET